MYNIFVLAIVNLRLPDHMNTPQNLEITSASSQYDEIISGNKESDCQQRDCSRTLVEIPTSSSEDGETIPDEKNYEIKTLQCKFLLPEIDPKPGDHESGIQSLETADEKIVDEDAVYNQLSKLHPDEDCQSNPEALHTIYNKCNSPLWIVLLGTLFYFFSAGVDGFFQSQTYSFALCGPLKLEPNLAGNINFAFFGSYCIGRMISIPISKKLHPSVIIVCALILCSLSSTFLALFGGSNMKALLVGNAVMGFSISFQFPSGLTWLASEIPGGMKSIYTSLMFTGANVGWIVLPPLASALFYAISPRATFITALICNILHMLIFYVMHKSSKYLQKVSKL